MFSKFFIERPIFATVLALLFVVAGLVTLNILPVAQDRKSTRLNSSHVKISYAVFCLKKKTKKTQPQCLVMTGNEHNILDIY